MSDVRPIDAIIGKMHLAYLDIRGEVQEALLQAQERLESAVRAEREACAKAAEEEQVSGETGTEDDKAYNAACSHVAASIRARGKR